MTINPRTQRNLCRSRCLAGLGALLLLAASDRAAAEPPAPTPPKARPEAAPEAAGRASDVAAKEARQWDRLRAIKRHEGTQRGLPAFAGTWARRGAKNTGPRAVVSQDNQVGFGFKIVSATYWLDGKEIVKLEMGSGLPDKVEIFKGSVFAGQHTLKVRIVLRGKSYGLFSYMSKYRIGLTQSETVYFDPSKATRVDVRIKRAASSQLRNRFYLDIGVH